MLKFLDLIFTIPTLLNIEMLKLIANYLIQDLHMYIFDRFMTK